MSLTTASVLAFERKLDPSDALMYAGSWEQRHNHDGWQAIDVREKSVRGTISNRLKSKKEIDAAKLDAEIEKPNLQRVDVATLPPDADTLKVRFTLRVLAGAGTPSACNNVDYQAKLAQVVGGYAENVGYRELARRYATNLANGRFLWRNRVGAETIEIQVSQQQGGVAVKTWRFDALAVSTRHFNNDQPAINEIAALIEQALAGKEFLLLEVQAFARMGDGQEVYPSQELILDKGSQTSGQKSKTLYTVKGIAAIHSQKLGNAIRAIDTWYPGADEMGPIAVEPYGSVTSQGKAYRQPAQKIDFYTLLDNWLLKDKEPALEQQHFVMATLIRGGVFGESGKE